MTKLVWITPDAESVIGYCARVSNPANQDNPDVTRLLRYCVGHGHWSIFEMASMCIEVKTTRAIAAQLLRHRSFSFQEFSQRYAAASNFHIYAARRQDTKNRQNSIATEDVGLKAWWENAQREQAKESTLLYERALGMGIAKEQARALLPEGLTSSRMYMSGTLRSWVTYLQTRLDPSTQKEHRIIAQQVLEILRGVAPVTMSAFFPEKQ